MLFQGEVDIGTKIIDPDGLRLGFGTGRTLIEENDVGLYARLVKDSGRQTEDRVQVAGSKELFADNLACAALKQHVVRHNHSGLARGFQNRVDMLDEIELFVAAGRPEILTVIYEVFFLLFAFLIGEGEGGFFAEGRVSENVIHAVAGIGEERIAVGDRNAAVNIPDVVQIQIHQAQLEGRRHQFISVESLVFEKFLLLPVERIILRIGKKCLRREEKAPASAAGIYKDVIFDTSPVAGKVYKNSENRRKQGVSCGFRCICRYSICPIRAQPRRP